MDFGMAQPLGYICSDGTTCYQIRTLKIVATHKHRRHVIAHVVSSNVTQASNNTTQDIGFLFASTSIIRRVHGMSYNARVELIIVCMSCLGLWYHTIASICLLTTTGTV